MKKIDWTKPLVYMGPMSLSRELFYLGELFSRSLNLRLHLVEVNSTTSGYLATVDDFGTEIKLHGLLFETKDQIIANPEYLYSYILLRTVVAQEGAQQLASSTPDTKERTMFHAKCKSPYWTIQGYLKYTIVNGGIKDVQFLNEEEFKNA